MIANFGYGTAKRNTGSTALIVLVVIALIGAALWYGADAKTWFAGEESKAIRGVPVSRGDLRISVVERGELEAADAASLKSEIEGRSTILWLIEEGTIVEKGQLVAELDVTGMTDNRVSQDIDVKNAEAALVKSQQNYEIQKSQNLSDIASAEQKLEFARQDLEKYQKGDRMVAERKADESITIAEEEAKRATDRLAWSEKLAEPGFLTSTELEADRLSATRTAIQLEAAKRDKQILVEWEIPRQLAELEANVLEAERELERVNLQAKARIVDFEADVSTNEARLLLEREKLAKIEAQIQNGKLYAPKPGMVVYGREEGGRMGGGDPMKEGTEVRERQEIITIPSTAGMIARASVHESVLKQVKRGLPVQIKVDAIPEKLFNGRVMFVAALPDKNSWYSNPNTRLFKTTIGIENGSTEMRPGMSCSLEILVEDLKDTLYVPVQCVFRHGGVNVCLIEDPVTRKVETREVEVGQFNDRWVQILSGVAEGEIALLSPPPGFQLDEQEDGGDEFPTGQAAGGNDRANAMPDGGFDAGASRGPEDGADVGDSEAAEGERPAGGRRGPPEGVDPAKWAEQRRGGGRSGGAPRGEGGGRGRSGETGGERPAGGGAPDPAPPASAAPAGDEQRS